ncbi:Uncharacterised protein [Candidatus Bilamarchaeum dharawalense]|uniref:Uncharacterized protein n=1 Tax=Candidatus Bilamarchaeum dharawalense TaxID=2885759 RepID=A0A5E4LQX8_9ARCH|nr:Uncharacterised protein [Candidatus Bilamarchaeum dharawalense]
MKILNVIIGVILILLLVLGGIVFFIFSSEESETQIQSLPPTFAILETNTAGDYGYMVYNYRGTGNITLISYDSPPKRSITIINDSQAIQVSRFAELVEQLQTLEKYGYKVTVSDEPKIGSDIYIIPTGALPSYALFNLQQGTNGTIIYIGAKDLILSSGIKEFSWYDQLSVEQRRKIIVYEGTLDELFEQNQVSLAQDILYNKWMLKSNETYTISGSGIKSSVVPIGSPTYLRLIFDIGDVHGIYDSIQLTKAPKVLVPSPPSIYPWEKSSLQFELSQTSGTAILTIKRDGDVVQTEELRRVTDQNVFIKKLEYSQPGEYTIFVDDNSGTIASGLLHLKDLKINYVNHVGTSYIFLITVDGKPMSSAEVNVWLGNSSIKKKFYVTNGEVVVSADLAKGPNTFNFDVGGRIIPVVVENNQEPVFGIYVTYGLPGLIIVIIVYFGARMTRKPTYRLRFGDSSTYVRQEIRLPTNRALESFKKIRHDMHLSKSPITPHEFTVSLKRYLTNGADVTEGNVEEILNRLVKAGYLETHRDYYQLKGEGNVKQNVLSRIIREKLIESGSSFTEQDNKFILKDSEIGFFGTHFTKKAIIVVDDEAEIKHILGSLSERERASLKIAQINDTLSFVTVDKLSGLL